MSTATKERPATKRKPKAVAATEFEFDAHRFSRAMRNMMLTTSNDDSRRGLCAVWFEVHASGVRLMSTDAYAMSYCWLGEEADEPAVSVEPLAAHPLFDESGRLPGILTWLGSRAWIAQTVRLEFVDESAVLTAGPLQLTMPYPKEMGVRSIDPSHVVTQPGWRSLVDKLGPIDEDEGVGAISLSPQFLARVTKIKTAGTLFGESTPLRFFTGKDQTTPVRFSVKADPTIHGLIMPVRVR